MEEQWEERCGCCGRDPTDNPQAWLVGFMDVPVCGSCSYHRAAVLEGEVCQWAESRD